MKFADVSPLAGMLTGEGAMGKLMAKGFGGMIPAAIARQAQKDAAEEERQKAIAASAQGQPMKKAAKSPHLVVAMALLSAARPKVG